AARLLHQMLSPKRSRSSICRRSASLKRRRLVRHKLLPLAFRDLRPWIAQRAITISADPQKFMLPRNVRLKSRDCFARILTEMVAIDFGCDQCQCFPTFRFHGVNRKRFFQGTIKLRSERWVLRGEILCD